MKIGVSTLAFYPQPLDEVLEYLEELKVKYCEVINEYPHHRLDPQALDSYNVKLTVHAPLSDINLASHNKSIRRSSVMEVKNSMDLAVECDADIVVVHPGSMPIMGSKIENKIFKLNLESLNECSQHAHDLGVYMCVENMPIIEGLLYQDLNELNKLIEDVDAQMTLDVGHAHNSGFSTDSMLVYDRIKHIHLSDNDGSFDHHYAMGNGEINFKSLLEGLKRIGYDDILVIEVRNPADVVMSLKYLEKLI